MLDNMRINANIRHSGVQLTFMGLAFSDETLRQELLEALLLLPWGRSTPSFMGGAFALSDRSFYWAVSSAGAC